MPPEETTDIGGDSHPQGPRSWFGLRPWHYLLALLFSGFLVIISPHGRSFEFAHLSVGTISPSRVIAPFDFEILKAPDALEGERREAIESILPVLTASNDVVKANIDRIRQFGKLSFEMLGSLPQAWLKATLDSSEEYEGGQGQPFIHGSQAIADQVGVRVSGDAWRFLFRLYLRDRVAGDERYRWLFDKYLPSVADRIAARGYCGSIPEGDKRRPRDITLIAGNVQSEVCLDSLVHPSTAPDWFSDAVVATLADMDLGGPENCAAAGQLLGTLVKPNLIYDREATESRRHEARARVPLAKGFVKQDELILDEHIRVTQDHLEKLMSLAIKRGEIAQEQGGASALVPLAGQAILALLCTGFLFVALGWARGSVFFDFRRMLLILILIGSALLFFQTIPASFAVSRQLFPVAFVVMMLIVLFDRGVALLGMIVLAIAGGFLQGNDFQTAATALTAGGVALASLRALDSRSGVVRTIPLLFGAMALLLTGFHLANYSSDTEYQQELLFAGVNAVLSPMLMLGLVPICENIFGITTDLRLLELVDLNRPLLRELAIKSPGTYHHSLMVGSLAEAAVREVGGNPLLARAGAYYHDIGKIETREYFIENQEVGSENIHDRLPPEESARMVISHVTRGYDLAVKHKLPPEVCNFILEHHGRTKVAYFLDKLERQGDAPVDEEQYRYPGPKPRSKETGVLMLADAAEAATRSLDNPTQHSVRGMLDKLFSMRLADGDLDDSPLSLVELQRVKEAFVRVLTGIHHQRVKYPGGA